MQCAASAPSQADNNSQQPSAPPPPQQDPNKPPFKSREDLNGGGNGDCSDHSNSSKN